MKKHSMLKLLSLVLVFVLTAAAALTGCSGAPAETTQAPQAAGSVTVLGEGKTSFDLTIVDKEGITHAYKIHTDAEMVGQALIALELIDGEEGPYGLYIKSVLGQTLDYETDGMYWSFYVGSEYALTGVDLTPITEGEHYQIKAEAA